MNVTLYDIEDYENEPPSVPKKTNPKQTQFLQSPKSLAKKSGRAQKYPKSNSSLSSGLKAIELSRMDSNELTRRKFLHYTAGSALALAGFPSLSAGNSESKLPPIRAITKGPKFHWFSYYDKLQFDPTCRYALAMEVNFEHRSPRPNDVISIGMVDLKDNNRWLKLGKSRSWCWQQGYMLQWLPGSKTQIIWNDREGDRFVCHILNVRSGKPRGYRLIEVDGTRISHRYISSAESHVSEPGEFVDVEDGRLADSDALIVNFFDASNEAKVFGRIDGGSWTPWLPARGHCKLKKVIMAAHHWNCPDHLLSPGQHLVEVRCEDRGRADIEISCVVSLPPVVRRANQNQTASNGCTTISE